MADYDYAPWHVPPIRLDRVGVRPWEHLAAGVSILVGAVLLLSTLLPDQLFGIEHLPPIILIIVGALVLVGGGMSLTGLQWPRRTKSVGWYVERVGCMLTFFGWLAAAITLTQVRPLMWFGLLMAVFFMASNLLRFLLLRRVEFGARVATGEVPIA